MPDRYPSRAAVETACGCMVVLGVMVLVLTVIAWWAWGPLTALGVVLTAVAIFGLLMENSRRRS